MQVGTAGSKGITTTMAKGLATTMLRVATLPASTRKSLVVKSMPYIETAPITVTMKLLDPEHGYRPRMYNGEGGSCETVYTSNFGFDAAMPVVKKVEGEFEGTLHCQSPRAAVAARFSLWLPEHSSWWLTDHEETHRAISERVYAEAVPKLSAILKKMDGKDYVVRAKTEGQAYAAARAAPIKEFNAAYARLMPEREGRLN